MVKRDKYRIKLKRSRLELVSTETPPDNTLQDYKIAFGEPVYLDNEKTLVVGPVPESGNVTTKIPDCNAVKLTSQKQVDPDNDSNIVNLVEQGVHYKDRTNDNLVKLTDNVANTIYPITTMSAIMADGSYELSEYLLHKLNIDKVSSVAYPSLGIDAQGVYVDDFEPVIPQEVSINQTLAKIVNSKVSIDEASAVVQYLALGTDDNLIQGYYYNGNFYEDQQYTTEITGEQGNLYQDLGAVETTLYTYSDGVYTEITGNEIAAGVDLIGVYVRIPDESADELNFIKAYIDAMLANSLASRLLALEGNIYYLQELINNINFLHVGPTSPQENNKLWIDTTVLTGGLKYCSNKITDTWSHVPVAYT